MLEKKKKVKFSLQLRLVFTSIEAIRTFPLQKLLRKELKENWLAIFLLHQQGTDKATNKINTINI